MNKPNTLTIGIILGFLVASIPLGEYLDFYELIWWWDLLLHGSFGMLLAYWHSNLFTKFYQNEGWFGITFISMLIVLTTLGLGATWEIIEYTADHLFNWNMQKSGLTDTMTDLLVTLVGAITGVVAHLLTKKNV